MKLTNYILDLGRVVAYYPGLKRITGSTTASIMLCQFLYWSSRTKDDGWIWKTSDEIEEETGLTYFEQKTARKILVDLHLLEEEFKRLEHMTRYRVNQEVLNTRWEEVTGKESEKTVVKVDEQAKPERKTIVATVKQGDILDGMLNLMSSAEAKKMNTKIAIKEKMEKRLHIVCDDKRWESLIDFVYGRQEKQKESIERFLDWAIKEGFDPVYWSPEKMRTVWPSAFVGTETGKPREDFVQKLPERKEEVYAPMPEDLGRKRNLI